MHHVHIRTYICVYSVWSNLSNRLSGDQCIQMVTALVLQMVQCIVINPRKEKSAARFTAGAENGDQSEVSKEV